MNTYTLRPYQAEAVSVALRHFERYRDPFILQAATGAGKSLIIADICHKLDQPVLILQPSKELVIQNHDKLLSYGVTDISMYSASVGVKEINKYCYATIGSIYKKPELFRQFKHIIVDECHLVDPKNYSGRYNQFFAALGNPKIMGLTATPYRLCQKYFKQRGQLYYTTCLKMVNRIYPYFFKKIVFKIETGDLIKQGYLCPVEYKTAPNDLKGLKLNNTGADFTTDSLEAYWRVADRFKRLVTTLVDVNAHHPRSLTFCSSVRQASRLQLALRDARIDVSIVTGETPAKEREDIVAGFRRGHIRHILNVGVFTTGFDVPELDCIVIARPTMSLSLWQQMVGRGLRLDPNKADKQLTVYDLAGVNERLGRVETVRIVKEVDGFRDKVVTECGTATETALFTFLVKRAPRLPLPEDS